MNIPDAAVDATCGECGAISGYHFGGCSLAKKQPFFPPPPVPEENPVGDVCHSIMNSECSNKVSHQGMFTDPNSDDAPQRVTFCRRCSRIGQRVKRFVVEGR